MDGSLLMAPIGLGVLLAAGMNSDGGDVLPHSMRDGAGPDRLSWRPLSGIGRV